MNVVILILVVMGLFSLLSCVNPFPTLYQTSRKILDPLANNREGNHFICSSEANIRMRVVMSPF